MNLTLFACYRKLVCLRSFDFEWIGFVDIALCVGQM